MLLLVVAACGGKKEDEQKQPPPAAPGTGIETSWTGYVSKTYDGSLDFVVGATRAAVQKLGLRLIDESPGLFRMSFDVESQGGESAVIQISELTKTTARVSIKVGYLLGNQDAARRIHSEIEAEWNVRHKWIGVPGAPGVPTPPSTPKA
jgi:hypothetical protein